MSYNDKRVLEGYKTYILHCFMTFLCFTITLSLVGLFLRLMNWVY
jgi:hypothetical protein